MNTGTTVVAITAAGLLGGFAGALLVHELDGPRLPPAGEPAAPSPERDPSLEKEVASLRARLDEMQASVQRGGDEAAKLREETVQVRKELEQERKTGAESRDRLAAVEAGGARGTLGRLLSGTGEVPVGEGQMLFRASSGDAAFGERMKKMAELRQKPEEERWAAARDALGLSGAQEEELKAALKERNEAMRAAIKMETKDAPGSDGSPQISVAIPDASKMVDARKKYDDRVNSALSADQSKKWRDDGYEGALGGGMRTMTFATVMADSVTEPPK
jgi:hypothetical protein